MGCQHFAKLSASSSLEISVYLELEEQRVDVERRCAVLDPLILQLDYLDELLHRLRVLEHYVDDIPVWQVLLEDEELLPYVDLEGVDARGGDVAAELDEPEDVLELLVAAPIFC